MVHFHMDWADICLGIQSNIPRSILVVRAAKICNFHLYWATFPQRQAICSEIFQHQQWPTYSIFMGIECFESTKGKAIFSEIFRHQGLLRDSIFFFIECTDFSRGKTVLSEIFHFHVYWVRILHQRQSNILWNISAPKAAEYTVFMCITCTYYTKGKPIFSEIFRNQQLPKHSIFTCIDCTYCSEGRTIFSEIFWHQLLPKAFTFTRIQCTCSTSHKQYSLEYFRAKSCWNISFSHVSSAHIIPKANQYSIFMCIECAYYSKGKPIFSEIFRHQEFPKYSIFICIACTNYPEGKTIFSKIFLHQMLSKDFIFTPIQCTCFLSHKQYYLEYFGTKSCRNISFSHRFSAHVPWATNNIPWCILVLRAAKALHCLMY